MSRLDELWRVREAIKKLTDELAWVMMLEPDKDNVYHIELRNQWMDYTGGADLYQAAVTVGKQLDRLIPLVQEAYHAPGPDAR